MYLPNSELLATLLAYRDNPSDLDTRDLLSRQLGILGDNLGQLLRASPEDVCDAVSHAWQVVDRFDPERGSNAFGFFTTVIRMKLLMCKRKSKIGRSTVRQFTDIEWSSIN